RSLDNRLSSICGGVFIKRLRFNRASSLFRRCNRESHFFKLWHSSLAWRSIDTTVDYTWRVLIIRRLPAVAVVSIVHTSRVAMACQTWQDVTNFDGCGFGKY